MKPNSHSAGAPLAALALLAAPLWSQAPPTPVRVEPVVEAELQERRLVTGDVVAARRSRVAAEEPGRVVSIAVAEGTRVEAGAELCTLDETRLALDVEVLRAQGVVADALVAERTSDLGQERRDLSTVEDLFERDAATPKELADARSAFTAAEARLAQAVSEVAVLDARLALLEDRLADLTIRAPFAGVVASVDAELGEWLATGDPVLELVSEEVEAWLEVPQRHLAAMRAGHGAIALTVGDGTDELLVTDWRLVPIVDSDVRMLTVIAPLATGAAAPGMSVRAWVPIGARQSYLTVPSAALLRNEIGPYLYVAQPAGEGAPHAAMPLPVEVLWREGDRAVVAPGALGAGAQAIVEGNRRLYPSAPVLPVNAKPDAGGEPGGGDAGQG